MSYRISRGSQVWIPHSDDGEATDLLDWLVTERADAVAGPLVALSRQQVVTTLGRGIPDDFPRPDVVVGDPEQAGIRGWWNTTVQAYLAGVSASTGVVEEDSDRAGTAAQEAGASTTAPGGWALKSRQWDDVEYSGADDRVLIITSHGIVNPAGVVVKPSLGEPSNLLKLAVKYPWANSEGEPNPQIWITGQALRDLEFPAPAAGAPVKLEDVIGEFFDCHISYSKSGFFTCEFTSPDPISWLDRKVEVILMPYTHMDPSKSRPDDRGVLGIVDTPTILPADEAEAAHLLADRIAWLYGLDGALAGPRWARVGAAIATARMRKARPDVKDAPETRMVPCLLPDRIAKRGKLPTAWWTKDSWDRQHRAGGPGIDVQVDQQAAYLPSAEGVYLGWGTPDWQAPDPGVFDQQRPPFGVFQLTVPPAKDLDGLSRKLPVPHPGMSWTREATFWATTVDVQQLIAPVEQGGAGLAIAELDIAAAYVWPKQHQWLRQFGTLLRTKLAAARDEERLDYEEMIKAIYKSFLGRLEAVGDTSWKHPYLRLQQPAWFTSIEGTTRWRAMRYACRIGREFDLYPTECLVDAWFYRIPKEMDPHELEDPLVKGVLPNGGYRLKGIPSDDTPSEADEQ